MSLEHEVSEILATLEEHRFDKVGQTAERVSHGIEQSGLVGEVRSGFSEVGVQLSGVAAALGLGLAEIAAEIARSNRFLGSIDETLRNPLSTTADERYRRGVRALERGWLPEALEELRAAVGVDPYVSIAHTMLGIALVQDGALTDAVESFRLAYRYATPDDPHIATGSALLGAGALEKLGRAGEAVADLKTALARYPDCAELAVTYVRLSGDTAPLVNAFVLAPELVQVARAAGIPGVDEAVAALGKHAREPLSQGIRVLEAVADLRDIDSPAEELGRYARTSPAELSGLPYEEALPRAGRALRDVAWLNGTFAQAGERGVVTDGYRLDSEVSQHESATSWLSSSTATAKSAEKRRAGHKAAMIFRLVVLFLCLAIAAGLLVKGFGYTDPDDDSWARYLFPFGGVLLVFCAFGMLTLVLESAKAMSKEAETRGRITLAPVDSDPEEIRRRYADRARRRRHSLAALDDVAGYYSRRIHPWSRR